jgi:hypothetical protein
LVLPRITEAFVCLPFGIGLREAKVYSEAGPLHNFLEKGEVIQAAWVMLRKIVNEHLQNVKKILFRIPERLQCKIYQGDGQSDAYDYSKEPVVGHTPWRSVF